MSARLDKTIRDTWEIARSRVKIEEPRWQKALGTALESIALDLGLTADVRLQAELHNMLVYAPGQFFVPHQDSEKSDAMIGTLVVTLPSEFAGGALVVRHHEDHVAFRGSGRDIGLVAFYADCHHEVRAVKSGHRIVLTYNLLLPTAAVSRPSVAPEHVERLERAVREFLRTPAPPQWRGAPPREPPDRLVYLLDHQYTQKGLGWARLKDVDAVRTAALREVARRLDCEVALALADVHESWSCSDEQAHDFGYRDTCGYDDGEDDRDFEDGVDHAGADLTLIDLIESSVELRHFIDASGKAEAASASVEDAELCFTKPSDEVDPFRSEHEGYMGNWGNTVDRWYHRAAVVIWPRARTFTIRAKASARWAIDEVARALTGGRIDEGRRMAAELLRFWPRVAQAEPSNVAARTLRVARTLDDRDLAAALLRPFRVEHLGPKGAPALALLVEHYGLRWFRDTCAAFVSTDPDRDDDIRPDEPEVGWLRALPVFVRALCGKRTADGAELARRIVSEQWRGVASAYRSSARAQPSRVCGELARLDGAILGLVASAIACEATAVHAEIVKFLRSDEGPSLALVRLLRTCVKTRGARGVQRLGIEAVHTHAVRRLETELRAPARAEDDWSIPAPRDCSCALCATLTRFLADRSRTRHEWPLAQQKRAHIHRVLDQHEIPVTHQRRRSGRPFTLALEKTRALFDREGSERAAKEQGLASLIAAHGQAIGR